MDLIKKYLGEGKNKVTLKFRLLSHPTSIEQQMDELDSLLVHSGVTGIPDSDNISITIDKKDLKKAEKALKGTIYRRYTVEK